MDGVTANLLYSKAVGNEVVDDQVDVTSNVNSDEVDVDDEADGDCYKKAFHIITDFKFPIPAFLCHGAPTGTGGEVDGMKFGHAWVELRGDIGALVIDFSNGHKLTAPRRVYYEVGMILPGEVRAYTRQEAIEHVLEHGHYGHWDPAFDGMLYR